VHPHRAILEPEYFIKKYEDADDKRNFEIQQIEAGFEEEPTGAAKQPVIRFDSIDGVQETEWEKI